MVSGGTENILKINIIKYYLKISKCNIHDKLEEAARLGDKELIDSLIKKGANFMESGIRGASKGGHKELIKFFIENGASETHIALYNVSEIGNKELVEFLLDYCNKQFVLDYGFVGAAKCRHIDLVQFFIDKGCNKWNLGMAHAASGGHLDIVKFFLKKGHGIFHGVYEKQIVMDTIILKGI